MAETVGVSVVFTDLVGSTELAAQLGAARAEELRTAHFGLVREPVETHGGREVKNLGDGIMAVFPGLASALDAAIAMQQSVQAHNALGEGPRIAIRVGVATGDCVEEQGDYFGEPVIQAARLCAAAEGGQILAPEVVRVLAPRGAHEFDGVGELDLKGLPEPTPAVEVVWHPYAAEAASLIPLPARLSIVYPFGFVGRDAECALLRDAWKAAASGERRVVLLSGEAGLGKTRLSTELAREAFESGGMVLYGRCDEEVPTPYRPWVEALDHYVTHASDDDLGGLDARSLGELAAVVPSVRGRLADGVAVGQSGGDGDQYVLFAAATSVLAALAVDRPVMIVLDDLHWADGATLQLLRHVVGHANTGSLLIVGTYRDTDIGVDDPLTATLAGLRREAGVERVGLVGLSDIEVLALLENTAGHEMDSDGVGLAHALRTETSGNPFFVGEMLRHLAETGVIERQDDGRWVATVDLDEMGLPESVREVVGARVRRLGDDALGVLSPAAVIGREFDAVTVAGVVDLDVDAVVDILEPAIRAGLVAEVADVADRFTFTHALVHRTLYDDLPASRRARWHRKVAETIEDLDIDVTHRAGELATHWFAATRPAEIDKAIRYATEAGDQAMAAFAPENAVGWYRQALEAIADEGSRQCCEVMVRLGDAERWAGDPAHRQRLLDAAYLAQRLGDTDLLVAAAIANNRGFASTTGRVDAERVEVLEAALAAFPGDSAERARLLATLAVELQYGADRRQVDLALDAIGSARRIGDPIVLAETIVQALSALAVPDMFDERSRLTDEAMHLTEGLENSLRERALGNQFVSRLCRGDMAGARACLAERRALVERLGDRVGYWDTLTQATVVALTTGAIVEAERLADDVLAVGLETGQADAATLYGQDLMAIRWFQGREGELTSLVADAADENPGLLYFTAVLAMLYATQVEFAAARAVFDRLAESGFAFPEDNGWLSANAFAAETACLLDDRAAAAVFIERLAPHNEWIAATGATCIGALSHHLGLLSATLGRQEQAEDYFVDALERHERLEAPFFQGRTLVELARVIRSRDIEHSDELLDSALALADTYGMAGIGERALALRDPDGLPST